MVTLQLLGQGAFIVASLILGTKLLAVWRRTHELPELTLGLSFLLGGGLGYIAWFAVGAATMQGAPRETIRALAAVGLACSCAGAVCNGLGIAKIFRAGLRAPVLGVVALGGVMVACWVDYVFGEPTPGSDSLWAALATCTPIYVWGAAETLSLAPALHKRAKLGLADPVVVNRVVQWGLAGLASVGMIAVSLLSRWLHGPVSPSWVIAINASFGLLAATTIWLGFFPPAPLRARLARAYAS